MADYPNVVTSQPIFSSPNQPVYLSPSQVPRIHPLLISEDKLGMAPRGLEVLAHLDHLVVRQKRELLEAILGCETLNKYDVVNSSGQQIFTAEESSNSCGRHCCGPARAFELSISDFHGQEVIHLTRPLKCDICCFPCCLQSIEVSSPRLGTLGRIDQQLTLMTPDFIVYNDLGDKVLRIQGPICTCTCFSKSVEFRVLSPDGLTQVGRISKHWNGFVNETFLDKDNFSINFPMDLDVKMKATLLGALFLIDFMYFESS